MLKDSLGGDSKTLMFVQVSPGMSSSNETLCSLRFAQRVRNVELGPAKQNVEDTTVLKYKEQLRKATELMKVKDQQLLEALEQSKLNEDKCSRHEQLYNQLVDRNMRREKDGLKPAVQPTKFTNTNNQTVTFSLGSSLPLENNLASIVKPLSSRRNRAERTVTAKPTLPGFPFTKPSVLNTPEKPKTENTDKFTTPSEKVPVSLIFNSNIN